MKSPNFTYLIIGAVIMALLPFGETPHLWQKLLLLKDGYLHQPMDWFDLLLHGGPLVGVAVLLATRALRSRTQRAA
ncbi:hypothetical protein [Turneriella parva]|uniref:RND transporter n=1 Tax=Turneriella parva (strain ATCC BAA-1111 / DSM 21527 / NCTC 11395 / H) TaxID=869212 RepID=I4B9D4_TURPD|nr:hypothetical protein [Turneriella parva]AFM13891.1 hypothetical protein Turpa_3252 [Turneriella parva DSM 21527]